MEKQRTVKTSVYFSGIALHTGARAGLRVLPAAENSGIIFRRVDLPGKPEVKALATQVADVRRGTTIASADGKAIVYTIEHIMASLHACGIDNAIVEMDGMEPPIGDGSAKEYLNMILNAGIEEQNAAARVITPKEPIIFEENNTRMVCLPSNELKISCITSFGACAMDTQYLSTPVNQEIFTSEIAAARTFVLYKDLEQLIAMGLVKGGSLDAAAILHDNAIICKEALRFEDEIVRHKILDIIGDLYLTGARVTADIIAIKPGHPGNVKLAQAIMQQYS